MIVLALREIRWQYRTWLGFTVVVIASSATVFLALALSGGASTLPSRQSAAVRAFTSPALGLSVLATLVVLSTITSLAVRSHRRIHALWSLAGATPAQIIAVAAAQIAAFTAIGAVIGSVIGAATTDAAFRVVVQQALPGFESPGTSPSWFYGVESTVITVVTVFLSSARGLNAVRAVEPLSALEEVDHRRLSVSWGRVFLFILVLGACLALVATFANTRGDGLASVFSLTIGLSMLLCICLTALVAAIGPYLFPVLMRAWTAIIPPSFSASWHLARNACLFHLTRSGAAISPLMVAISVTAGVYTVFLTAGVAQAMSGADEASGINDRALAIMLSGPLLISALGAGATMFMSGATRQRDLRLLLTVGANQRVLAQSVLWEAVIYCATATIAAVAIVATVGSVAALAFGRVVPGVIPAFGIVPGLIVAAASLCVVVAAVSGPALRALSTTGSGPASS